MAAFDIRAFAKAVRRRREELQAERPYHRVPIDDVMSRVLESDEEYVPPRKRKVKARRPTRDPRVSSVVRIANALETTPDDLLGFKAFVLTKVERRTMRTFVEYLVKTFGLDSPDLDEEKPPSEIAGG